MPSCGARAWREAERRVLVLGDSFLVPGAATGRLLAEALERGIGVRNLAVSGTGPLEYLAGLEADDAWPPPDGRGSARRT